MRLASRVLALLLPISSAALADDQEQCFKAEGQDSIIACMRLIDSGKLQGRELAVAHLSSGLAWSKLGDLGRAIQKYSEAIQVDPSYVIALNNRCAVYNRQREFDRAIQDCERAISLDPSYVNAYVGRGDAHRLKRDYDRAVLDYDQALGLNPKSITALTGRAQTYAAKRSYDNALKDYNSGNCSPLAPR